MYFVILAAILYCFSAISSEEKPFCITDFMNQRNTQSLLKRWIEEIVNNENLSNKNKIESLLDFFDARLKNANESIEQIKQMDIQQQEMQKEAYEARIQNVQKRLLHRELMLQKNMNEQRHTYESRIETFETALQNAQKETIELKRNNTEISNAFNTLENKVQQLVESNQKIELALVEVTKIAKKVEESLENILQPSKESPEISPGLVTQEDLKVFKENATKILIETQNSAHKTQKIVLLAAAIGIGLGVFTAFSSNQQLLPQFLRSQVS